MTPWWVALIAYVSGVFSGFGLICLVFLVAGYRRWKAAKRDAKTVYTGPQPVSFSGE